jgi:hypothetical protein
MQFTSYLVECKFYFTLLSFVPDLQIVVVLTDMMEYSDGHLLSDEATPLACRSQNSLQSSVLDKNRTITDWLLRSNPIVMSTPSETHSDDLGSLGESGYDFIDTDEESRGAATEELSESIASDFGRPDDVASLADTEQSYNEDSESEKSHVTGGIPAFTGLDGPQHTPTITRTDGVFGDDDKAMAHSIEFEEPLSLGDENVSVKHTVADFNEDETARIVENMMLRNPPKRLVATIRQTMTRQGLSTKEPLRILYVGCQSAKQDIIRKIASSVAASVGNGRNSVLPGHRSSQLFHVVPITAFGSEEPPQIELMQSSGYQIKVEDCSNAFNIKYEDRSDRPDILKIMLDDDNYGYHSIPEENSFRLEPAWDLPHVAVFYCSENDTADMKRMRTIAKTFMSRHKVPSIVISHKQFFDKSFGGMALDQHAIHMCLESRDPNGPRNIIHQRLPIDLDSFKTIDARQMNRNLAYLTGLHEPVETPSQSTITTKLVPRLSASDIEKTSYSLGDSVSFLRTRACAEWRALIPVGLLLLFVFGAVTTGSWKYRTTAHHAVSINGNLTFTEPTSAVSATTATATFGVSTSLMTSTMTQTATRTITVVHSESMVANSLAIKPSMELGRVNEKAQATTNTDEKSTLCSAEILGEREILIRIPEAKMMSWLSKEALSVNVSRESGRVEPERVYTTANGIILQLVKEEAYGFLNVSIITTKKPKINETFGVDFGPDWAHDFKGLFWARIQDHIHCASNLVNSTVTQWWNYAEKVIPQPESFAELTKQRLEEVNKLAAQQAAESSKKFTKAAKDISLKLAKWSAILSKEVGMQISEAQNRLGRVREEFHAIRNQPVREPLDNVIFRAQVNSKLYWLKLQGRHVEYQEYEKRVAEATKRRLEERVRIRKTVDRQMRKLDRRPKKSCQKKAKSGCGS